AWSDVPYYPDPRPSDDERMPTEHWAKGIAVMATRPKPKRGKSKPASRKKTIVAPRRSRGSGVPPGARKMGGNGRRGGERRRAAQLARSRADQSRCLLRPRRTNAAARAPRAGGAADATTA